jgi:hypothetical protein
MFQGLKVSLGQFQYLVVAEEAAVAAGPEAHQAYLKVHCTARGISQAAYVLLAELHRSHLRCGC